MILSIKYQYLGMHICYTLKNAPDQYTKQSLTDDLLWLTAPGWKQTGPADGWSPHGRPGALWEIQCSVHHHPGAGDRRHVPGYVRDGRCCRDLQPAGKWRCSVYTQKGESSNSSIVMHCKEHCNRCCIINLNIQRWSLCLTVKAYSLTHYLTI